MSSPALIESLRRRRSPAPRRDRERSIAASTQSPATQVESLRFICFPCRANARAVSVRKNSRARAARVTIAGLFTNALRPRHDRPAMSSARPQVVIVGAGFGGLFAAQALAKADADVTIIDRHNYHLFQPLLYQVATAGLPPSDIAWPIRSILHRQRNARVLLAEVLGIDRERRVVELRDRTIPFDYLVVATGSTHSYFGHEQWRSIAPGLKSIDDATLIRRRILSAFEAAEMENDPAKREPLLTFVIVGAGPTGVELAGTIAELAHRTLLADFRRIDPGAAKVILIEAGPRVLAAFREPQSALRAARARAARRRSARKRRGHRVRRARRRARRRAHRERDRALGRGRRGFTRWQVARCRRPIARGACACAPISRSSPTLRSSWSATRRSSRRRTASACPASRRPRSSKAPTWRA